MKTSILLAIIFFKGFSARAQVYDRKIIHYNDNLSSHFTYRFPLFEEGTVLFKNGKSLKSRMNFNTLLCDMQFIDPKGDTLGISKPGDIDSILFNNCTFFFQNGYLEIINMSDSVKLVVSRKASFEPVRIGAMGIPSHNTAVLSEDNYSSKINYVKALQLNVNVDIDALEKTEYFLIINKNEMIKANKANFLKVFNGDKKRIENFLKMNKLNFNSQNDLRKLFQFCTHP